MTKIDSFYKMADSIDNKMEFLNKNLRKFNNPEYSTIIMYLQNYFEKIVKIKKENLIRFSWCKCYPGDRYCRQGRLNYYRVHYLNDVLGNFITGNELVYSALNNIRLPNTRKNYYGRQITKSGMRNLCTALFFYKDLLKKHKLKLDDVVKYSIDFYQN